MMKNNLIGSLNEALSETRELSTSWNDGQLATFHDLE